MDTSAGVYSYMDSSAGVPSYGKSAAVASADWKETMR